MNLHKSLSLSACSFALIITALTQPSSLAKSAESAENVSRTPVKQSSLSDLEAGFTDPAPEYGPRTWWHWLNSNVSIDGITKDLEAMKNLGYKGAHMVNLPQGGPFGKDVFGTPQWYTKVDHAVKECERLGLELSFGSCVGWVAGGPWVPAELSMQDIVWRHHFVAGNNDKPIRLPQPTKNRGFYREVAVLAYPSLPGEAQGLASLNVKVSSELPGIDWSAAVDGNPETFVELPRWKADEKSRTLIFEFEEPIDVRSLSMQMQEDSKMRVLKLHSSDDGKQWRPLITHTRWHNHFDPAREELIEGFPERKARFVKLELMAPNPKVGMKLYEVNFLSSRLNQIRTKAGRQRTQPTISNQTGQVVPLSQIVKADQILDLTDYLNLDGTLDYTLPEGQWTILRFGHTSNGNEISPAAAHNKGLETDKMSVEALHFHMEQGVVKKTLERMGPLTGKVLAEMNIDSWEAGCQTWTAKFPEEFQQRRGYDMRKWLIALTGRFVESVDQTERFMWDYRRTIGDLIAFNFYGAFREYIEPYGLKLSAEAPGIGMPIQCDQIQVQGQMDIPQGEFWLGPSKDPRFPQWPGGQDNTKEAAVAAHVYGKKVVSCEAFTSFGHHDGFTQHPFSLKPVGDRQFCKGMNEIVFHCYAHQPDDRVPAMTLGQFGVHMQRSVTWWNQARDWITYLRRCQFMLRQGRFFADACYYYGEDVPGSAWYFAPGAMNPRTKMLPVLPEGYDYDVCNREILDMMTVEDGLVALPSGMRYAYLVLPNHARYTPEALEKVHALVNAGATIIGPRPSRSPSLQGFPQSDEKIKALAASIWPEGSGAGERQVGKGKIITGKSFEQILEQDKLLPDFTATLLGQEAETEQQKIKDDFATSKKQIRYIHRKIGEGDVYFIASQSQDSEEATLRFRISGKSPELWDPATGKRSTLTHYVDDGTTTTLKLKIDPHGSRFVFFHKVNDRHNLKTIVKDGQPVLLEGDNLNFTVWENGKYATEMEDGSKAIINVANIPTPETVPPGWAVTFQKERGAPEGQQTFDELASWTTHPEEGIKYFSGTATYEKGINISQERLKEGQRVYLDLGDVKYVAEVFVNDQPLGVLWKPPFRVDITDAAKPGANKVKVEITNVWKNRLIKDAQLPKDQRITWCYYPFYRNEPDAPLMASGLLGPVKVLNSRTIKLD
ncbi:MAG: glycosyl hydrolase [Akkermansiaceae bacterium]|nr:glycosyl hydrolase [Akkermansiaceae bacterium]